MELTIEQKAKAYDEAIERARIYIETDKDNTMQVYARRTMEYLFPELEESKDEKIRKALISVLKSDFEKDTTIHGITVNDILAWLEKQDAQTIKEALRTEYEKGRADAIAEFEKQGEWSEEDERMYQSALWHIKNSCGNQGKTSGEFEVYN